MNTTEAKDSQAARSVASEPSEAPVRSSDLLAVWRWAVIENIVTIICTLLGCWLVSGWFALLMLNINYRKKREDR